MSDQLEFANLWLEDATGTPVDMEPISRALVAAASTNAIPRVKSDDTLELATLTAGTDITITHGAGTITIASTASGGGSGEGALVATRATPTDGDYNSAKSDHFTAASLDAKWSSLNAGSLTVTMGQSCCVLSTAAAATQGKILAVPSGNFTVVTVVSAYVWANYHHAGLVLYEASSQKKVGLHYERADGFGVYFQTISSDDLTFGTIGSDTTNMPSVGWIFLKLTYDGTSYRGYWSPSGVPGTWRGVGTHAKAAHFTAGASNVGIYASALTTLTQLDAAFDMVFVWDAVV